MGKELASKLPGVQKRTQSAEDMHVLMLQAQLDKLRTLPLTPSDPPTPTETDRSPTEIDS